MPCCNYSDDELRAAWRSAASPTWPPSFEACIADPVLFRLIRLEAYVRARRAAKARARIARALKTPGRHQALDHKRLAAGEREDD